MDDVKKILIIEDDLALAKILNDRLLQEGISVFEAHDGVEGLKIALDSQPDLILLDILMPQMDGLSVLKELREKGDYGRDVPVMILTNQEDLGAVSGAMNAGSFDYIIKSDWKLDEVIKKIKDELYKKV